jgi:predicted restriction endonuclease
MDKVSHMKKLFPTLPPLPPKSIKRQTRQGIGQKTVKYRKKQIPTALREAVWIKKCGRVFEHKCNVTWCPNTMTAYDFQAGHNIPESKGGPTNIDNLIPICGRCNNSMGDRYTIDEWNSILGSQAPPPLPPPSPQSHEVKNLYLNKTVAVPEKKGWFRFLCCPS